MKKIILAIVMLISINAFSQTKANITVADTLIVMVNGVDFSGGVFIKINSLAMDVDIKETVISCTLYNSDRVRTQNKGTNSLTYSYSYIGWNVGTHNANMTAKLAEIFGVAEDAITISN